jgi:hypothetical protein
VCKYAHVFCDYAHSRCQYGGYFCSFRVIVEGSMPNESAALRTEPAV